MIEERNIYMTDSFMKILENVGIVEQDNSSYLKIDEDKNTYFIPPHYASELDNIYCDVEGYNGEGIKQLHDVEYIYDVEKTYKMRGKCHKDFKHNVNIFSNNIDKNYKSDFTFKSGMHTTIMDMHTEWIEPDLIYANNEFMFISLLYNHMNEFNIMPNKIFYLEEEPVAFVLYDESPKYTHLYFIYAVPTIQYLEDYVTWTFFRQKMKDNNKKDVNYGGVYGDSNIKKIKERICPYEVRDRWSWSHGLSI